MVKEVKYWIDEHIQNRRYIFSLAKSSAVAETEATTLGVYWNLVRDVIFFITYSFFMIALRGRGGESKLDGMPQMIYLYTGLVSWYLINDYLTQGIGCMLKNKGIFTKIKFPIMIIPTFEVLAIFYKRIVTFAIFVVLLIYYGLANNWRPDINIFGLVYSLIGSVIFGIAYSLFMSGFYTISKDFRELYKAIVRVMFYFVPVFWTVSQIAGSRRFGWVAPILNNFPPVHLINSFRYSIALGQFPPWQNIGIFILICLFLFSVGCFLQYRLQRIYADFV